MIRTQVFLTEGQRDALTTLESVQDKSMGALIRVAIDEYLIRQNADWKQGLAQAVGLWSGREDLPDFDAMRRDWDR